MKINPFRKKSLGRHFDKLQAKYNELDRKLDATINEQKEAEADFAEKNKAYREMEERSTSSFWSAGEKSLNRARNYAEHQMRQAQSKVRELQHQIAPLHSQVIAPAQMAEAKETYLRLTQQDQALSMDFEKANALKTKLEQKIAKLEQNIAAETQAAASAMAAADGEIVLPEGLSKLDMELRVTQATLIEINKKLDILMAEMAPLPKQIRDARDSYISYRATVAKLEMMEPLPTFVEIIARASVARHLVHYTNAANRFEIEIPEEVVTAMEATLNAELATA
jgi:chromosome segregation ATPase